LILLNLILRIIWKDKSSLMSSQNNNLLWRLTHGLSI